MGIINWFKCGNDCSNCNYCWSERTSYEYDEYDAGCYIKGDCYDDQRCYILPPIRFIIGSIRRKKAIYYRNHEYDDLYDWSMEKDNKENKFRELVSNFLSNYSLCHKDNDGNLYECDKEGIIDYEAWRIRSEYEDFAYPIIHKKLRSEWKDLIKKTFNSFVDKFKPYFCK